MDPRQSHIIIFTENVSVHYVDSYKNHGSFDFKAGDALACNIKEASCQEYDYICEYDLTMAGGIELWNIKPSQFKILIGAEL